MLGFEPIVTAAQVEELRPLAAEIWHEYYTSLIGAEQVRYMLNLFHTPQSVLDQIAGGYAYFLLRRDGEKAGYVSVQAREGYLCLSKYYLAKAYRHQGLGRQVMAFVENLAREQKLPEIRLNVNRDNHDAVAVYRALGFTLLREEKNDIGQGYSMDDFVLVKKL